MPRGISLFVRLFINSKYSLKDIIRVIANLTIIAHRMIIAFFQEKSNHQHI
jgi:hypothetical protein